LCSLQALPSEVKELYGDSLKRNLKPEFDSLLDLFMLVTKRFSSVFVFMDALDECHTNYHEKIFLLIQRFSRSSIKVMLTSRPDAEISKKLEKLIELPISAQDGDIERYLNSELGKKECEHLHSEIKCDIVETLTSGTKGMYVPVLTHEIDYYLGFD